MELLQVLLQSHESFSTCQSNTARSFGRPSGITF